MMVDHLPSSDRLLAYLLPLILFFVGLQLAGKPSLRLQDIWREIRQIVYGTAAARAGHFSLTRALLSYDQYAELSRNEIANMRSSYGRLGWAHRRIGSELGYTKKLQQLDEAMHTNAKVTQGIAALARNEFRDSLRKSGLYHGDSYGDLGRVRESLKHFVRDWSEDGREERAKIFGPILDVLRDMDVESRKTKRALVPGCGLGRLAWEISQLGYQTTANELSFFMNLAFRFLLSDATTQRPEQHVIQPYASWFSHQRTNDNLFRAVRFPDAIPRKSDALQIAECDFLSLHPPPSLMSGKPDGYDYVVTLFFIDTSLNVIETIEQIYSLLRPGGLWINLGPLLWTNGAQAAVELSLDEIMKLIQMSGFTVQEGSTGHSGGRRTIECQYTADKHAMMKWLYQAEFWVARKNEQLPLGNGQDAGLSIMPQTHSSPLSAA